MFKTCGDAMIYCKKFGLDIHPMSAFETAKALHRAYLAGYEAAQLQSHSDVANAPLEKEITCGNCGDTIIVTF